MHPLVRTYRHLLGISAIWILVSVWVIVFHHLLSGGELWHSGLLLGLPMVLELFLCLATWYICKIAPIKPIRILHFSLTHLVSFFVFNGIWLLSLYISGIAWDYFFKWDVFTLLFVRSVPALLTQGATLYLIFILIHYLMLMIDKSQESEREALRQRVLAYQAELKELKAFVHPHFLFNSLTLLEHLLSKSPAKARNIIPKLSDFLLYSIRYGQKDKVQVRDELTHIQNYIAIERERLGGRLQIKWEIDEKILDDNMIPLTLLPIVENAVKHGISQCVEGGLLEISIGKRGNHGEIKVRNPFDSMASPQRGGGLGLKNLKQRMMTYYGSQAIMETSSEDECYSVRIVFPLYWQGKK